MKLTKPNKNRLMKNMCRTCLKVVTKNFKHLFADRISELLNSITNLKVSACDGLSEIVCLECSEQIRLFYDFRQKCHDSNKYLSALTKNVETSLENTVCLGQNEENVKQDRQTKKLYVDINTEIVENNQPNVQFEVKINQIKRKNPNFEYKIAEEKYELKSYSSKCNSLKVKNEFSSSRNSKNLNIKKTKNLKPEQCDVCNILIDNSKILKRHKESHDELNPRKYVCDLCYDAFYEKPKLLRHKNRHNNLKKYKCENCNEQFYDIGALVRHTEINHKHLELKKCKICMESFTLERQYDHHMKKSHGIYKEYKCSQCNEIFILPKMLLRHENIHKYGKPYPCTICSLAFQNSKTLKFHLKKHTGESSSYIVCSICGKQIERYRITKHVKIHGDKPFKCKICPRACAEKWELVNHMKIHTGEKRFICNICGNRFLASQTLKKHLLIHTGEKPHVCTVCGHAFRQRGTLKTHMKIHRSF